MTSNSILLRFFPFFLFAGLAILSWALHFNGLYGQDAHEYLRQSKAIFEYWRVGTAIPITVGNAEFGSGYPFLGALLCLIVGDPVLALQMVSWLSFATSAWFLERILATTAYGSRADSRLVFTTLGLVLAPVLIRAGLVSMSDGLGLALALGAFFFSLRWMEHERAGDTLWAAVFIAMAVSVRIGLAGLMLPLSLVVGWLLVERRKWRWLALATLAGLVVLLPHFWMENDVIAQPFLHSAIHWSPVHFFQRSFHFENGLSQYFLPNALYIAFPLVHPGFCLVLPGLLLLAKKTDLTLPAKKAILFCLAAYLLLLGGLPHQNLRFLLPAYALVLVLMFPAWDRLYCYGLHFFKRLTWGLIVMTFCLQLFFSARMFVPTLARNHLEQTVAAAIRPLIPSGGALYGFDLDIALHTYLPDIQFFNLWERRYENVAAGSFVLFNEPALRQQWDGQNPMLNWDFLLENYEVEAIENLPEDWVLYKVGSLLK